MTSKYTINAQTIHSVGDFNTVHISTERKELDTLLVQALKQVEPDSQMHQAMRSLQNDLDTNGAPTPVSRGLIEGALEALPHADKAVGIGHKIVGIMDKLGYLPS